jgi:hypothetical protein
MKTLTITRSKWARKKADGTQPHGPSYLLNGQGAMCCLGFDCKANGIVESDLFQIGMPSPSWTSLTWDDVSNAIDANDRTGICHGDLRGEEEQERVIAVIFARNGVEVTFVD